MDKYEYKVRADEIKSLIEKGDYAQAAEIADTIDWRRVKSVMMLCTISDLYKINRRYEDARDMLLLAYERRPGGRNICYSLCELSIKTGEFVQAMEYYKEFVQVAPRDPGRYILQYKLYEDQDVSLEERIDVLEELKKHDYREKWAYELAYLYHRVGLATRCVEECDELILWFGEGDYVIKAMELKMLHQPLSAEQQEIYDHRFDAKPAEEEAVPEQSADDLGATKVLPGAILSEKQQDAEEVTGDTITYKPIRVSDTGKILVQEEEEPEAEADAFEDTSEMPEELDIHVKTMDVGQYNTINLQAELAEELKLVLGEVTGALPVEQTVAALESEGEVTSEVPETTASEDVEEVDEESLDGLEMDEADEEDLEPEPEEMEQSEVFFGATGEIVMEQLRKEEEKVRLAALDMVGAEPPKEIANVLSQEADGQISIVVPEKTDIVEKQITGQMNIEDVLVEWERMKKENEEKRKEEVRQHVLQQTGSMFTEFEAAVRDGLLEKLEKGEDADVATSETVEPDVEADVEGSLEAAEEFETEEIEEAAEEIAEEATEEVAENAEEVTEAVEETEEITEEEIIDESDEVEEIEEIEGEVVEESEEETDEETEAESDAEDDEVEEIAEVEDEVPEDLEDEETSEEAAEEEEIAEEASEDTEEEEEEPKERVSRSKTRPLTREEKELYGKYLQSRNTKDQLVQAVDNLSLAAYTGNLIVTGAVGVDTLPLAKNIVRGVQMSDSNFSGKVAKISGQGLNRKNMEEVLPELQNGALIVQNASEIDEKTLTDLNKALQTESYGIIVILQDDTKSMNKFCKKYGELLSAFTARVDIEALSNDMLVAYAKRYAREMEFAIDDMGELALHTRIEERQTIDHAVTTAEVREIVDAAIQHASRKTLGHFFDIMFGRRYDEEDMILITEKDFK